MLWNQLWQTSAFTEEVLTEAMGKEEMTVTPIPSYQNNTGSFTET